ncbi:hypothetical protein PIB30_007056 [Stylosanthes scabra]|uniref:Replication protein A 70 kDa DNA-binding subunit B/D first OB fold domain-containing protein n=1 Tax=Stylosanthes scabra TaxID=79078 RepID=A0ABU6Q4G5_9FABA|nr:hypothetical protein [Stylosanthes scabra]
MGTPRGPRVTRGQRTVKSSQMRTTLGLEKAKPVTSSFIKLTSINENGATSYRPAQGIHRYDRIVDITPVRLDWNLVVGVVRMYELPIPSNPSDFYEVDLILQDKEGDCILCCIPKDSFGLFKTLIREFGIYNMREFIVQPPGKGVKVSSHKFKLMFFRKTSVAKLSMDTFPSSPFRVIPFPGVADMTTARQFQLIDCLGHVVGKEEVIDMVTRNGDPTKRMVVL